MHMRVFKEYLELFAVVLSVLFNKSLQSDNLPSDQSIIFVTLIFKRTVYFLHYRPRNLTSTVV